MIRRDITKQTQPYPSQEESLVVLQVSSSPFTGVEVCGPFAPSALLESPVWRFTDPMLWLRLAFLHGLSLSESPPTTSNWDVLAVCRPDMSVFYVP